MIEVAKEYGIAIIADEVFWDYLFATGAGSVSTLQPLGERDEDRQALTFTLGGLSKSCGLPHMKLAWIVVGGPPARVEEALANGPSAQMPVRKSVPRPDYVKSADDLVTMDVDWEKVAESVEPANAWLLEFLSK